MKFLKWELPAWLWVGIVMFLTWWPKIEIPDIGINFEDKIAHLLAFGLLGFLVVRARCKNEINQLPDAVKLTLLSCSLFAVFDEAMQALIPGRVAGVWDGVANISGIFFAVILFKYVWLPWRSSRINRPWV